MLLMVYRQLHFARSSNIIGLHAEVQKPPDILTHSCVYVSIHIFSRLLMRQLSVARIVRTS